MRYVLDFDFELDESVDEHHSNVHGGDARDRPRWSDRAARRRRYARAVNIEIFDPMPTRPCRFCLCMQGGAVFADFDVDPTGAVFAVRVSFDGYGCCTTPATIGRMSAADSATLLAMIEAGAIIPAAAEILRAYFRDNRDAIWSDALVEHGLT